MLLTYNLTQWAGLSLQSILLETVDHFHDGKNRFSKYSSILSIYFYVYYLYQILCPLTDFVTNVQSCMYSISEWKAFNIPLQWVGKSNNKYCCLISLQVVPDCLLKCSCHKKCGNLQLNLTILLRRFIAINC